ncbi:uncharacterized protein BO97DRAFT_360408 [Aspergillus homomorphus CBS 101889]|uniref:Uncharacterized protein n=1 Tax=Aspergillus homomorphus (strain CBS 101889) TaxID=1450537 RepID=A0A395IAQ2_ASPHC|nr:hypothetical protein BO97DRAFT_360408 [Aspergillus homomorphus CBS 101889]RAL16889.1 hypothetical protein BO97DRAFT_360408 [Aspergillus homomorphus CBS 101889]
MSERSRPQNSSILGASWVVAPAQPPTEASDTTPRPDHSHHDSLSESISTSCSSISGPDLIMPSIYEAPISEGSWIAPTASPKHALRRRHPASSPVRDSSQRAPAEVKENATPTVAKHEASNNRLPFILPSRGFFLRMLMNGLLVASICHMLILPELVQQYQSLCSIQAFATLYPVSCIPLYLKSNNPISQPHTQPLSQTTYNSLETLLNNTLQTMAPHSTTLKHTESKLRDIHQLLKKQYPGSKHELDLEFTGCLQATRTATRRFDSLHADLRSAVDSLIAARGSGSGSGSGRGSAAAAAAAAATGNTKSSADARLSTTQLSRREQYVDQLTSRMQTKADSLLSDFATLDDHLESIAGVVKREQINHRSGNDDPQGPGSRSSFSSSSTGLKGIMVNAIFGTWSHQPPTTNNNNQNSDDDASSTLAHHNSKEEEDQQKPPLPTLFQDAATRHQPVKDAIRKLSDGLQQLQNSKKGMLFHS